MYHNHTIKSYIFIIYGYQMFGEHCLFLVAWFKKNSINFLCCPFFVCGFFFLFHFVVYQEAKEQLSPLSAALEKLQQEKQELLERKRQKQEEGQEKVGTVSLLSLLERAFSIMKKQHRTLHLRSNYFLSVFI